MYSFKNDYTEGAHPRILDALVNQNLIQEEGYGMDSVTQMAIAEIKKHVDGECDIHLIAGGTLTNLIAISAFLRPHEACIAARSGHIAVHETGAIEATGHKIITLDSMDGKVKLDRIQEVLEEHHFEHMVKPKLVYISNPTEVGTVYSKDELIELYGFCKERGLKLYIDGARLGAALTTSEYDLSLNDIYNNSDAFFIGGTKVGALLGEALVVKNLDIKDEMRYIIKQRGALLAKGRILGTQFYELFKDGLYFELAKHGNKTAQRLAEGLSEKGCDFLAESHTNQIFPIIEEENLVRLEEEFSFYRWKDMKDGRWAIRLITSWATEVDQIEKFIDIYKASSNK